MSEQRYLAVLAVIRDGDTVTEVAARFEVTRMFVRVAEVVAVREMPHWAACRWVRCCERPAS